MFSLHTSWEKFENAIITGHFGFVFEENWRTRKPNDYRDVIVFGKLRFRNVFSSTLKRKAGVLKFFLFEERFPKAPFP